MGTREALSSASVYFLFFNAATAASTSFRLRLTSSARFVTHDFIRGGLASDAVSFSRQR